MGSNVFDEEQDNTAPSTAMTPPARVPPAEEASAAVDEQKTLSSTGSENTQDDAGSEDIYARSMLFERAAAKKLKDERQRNAGGWDYLTDIPKGIVNGASQFAQSIAKLGADVTGLNPTHERLWDDPFETYTITGGLARGLTDFALAFVPVGGLLGKVEKAMRLGELGVGMAKFAATKASTVVGGLTKMSVATFLASDEYEGRLADVAHEIPVLRAIVPDFLRSDPDDSWVVGRMKNVLEGLGMGLATDVAVPMMRGWKNVKSLTELGRLDDAAKEFAKMQTMARESVVVKKLSEQIKATDIKVTDAQLHDEWVRVAHMWKYSGEDVTFDQWLEKNFFGYRNGEAAWNKPAAEIADDEVIGLAQRKPSTTAETTYFSRKDQSGYTILSDYVPATGYTEQVSLKQGAKILSEGTREWRRIVGRAVDDVEVGTAEFYDRVAQVASDRGYDAVHFLKDGVELTDGGTLLVNPKAITSSRVAPKPIPAEFTNKTAPSEIVTWAKENGYSPAAWTASNGATVENSETILKRLRREYSKVPQAPEVPAAKPAAVTSEQAVAAPMPTAESAAAPVAEPAAAVPAQGLIPGSPRPDGNIKGFTQVLQDHRALITLYKGSDVSTLAHEHFHFFKTNVMKQGDREILEKALGVKKSVWTEAHEEAAAQLWERYLLDGVTPKDAPKGLLDMFSRMKQWMISVYHSVDDSPLAAPVAPEIKAVFDKISLGDSTLNTKDVVTQLYDVVGNSKTIAEGLAQNNGARFKAKYLRDIRNGIDVSPEVQDEAVKTILNAMKNGTPLDEAARSVPHPWNYSKINVDTDTEAILRFNEQVYAKTMFEGEGRVESMAKAVEYAKEFLAKSIKDGTILDKMAKDAVHSNGLGPRIYAYRKFVADMGTEVSKLARLVIDHPNNTDLEERLLTTYANFAKASSYTHFVRNATGKALRLMGETVDGDGVELGKLLQLTRDTLSGGGRLSRDELLNRLTMAAGDPSTLDKVFHWMNTKGDSWLRKALNIHNEIWINGILGSVQTQAANVMNGVVQMLLAPAERWVGGVLTGSKEARDFAFDTYYGLVKSAFDSFSIARVAENMPVSPIQSATRAFMGERPMLDPMSKLDMKELHALTAGNLGVDPTTFTGKLINGIGQFFRIPTRCMTAEDDMMKGFAAQSYLYAEGCRLARQKGITDASLFNDEVMRFVRSAFDSDTGALTNDGALQWARKITATMDLNPETLGADLLKVIQNHPGLRTIAPFVRTPTNLFRQFWQYTPGLNFFQKQFRRELMSADPMVRSSAWGRVAVGMAFTMTATSAAFAGTITGGGPSNPEERAVLLATGWQPYSFAFTGENGKKQYVSFNRMDPYGAMLGMAADFVEASAHMGEPDRDGVGTAILMSIAKNVTNKTFLAGISEVVNFLSNPDRNAAKFWQQRMASYVPNYLKNLNDDEIMRDTRGILDAMRRKIPGLSDKLPPRRNILGEVVPVPGGYLPGMDADSELGRRISPLAFSQRVGDPIKEEMAKLQYGFNRPDPFHRGIDLRVVTNETDGQDAYDFLQQRRGEVTVGGKRLHEALEALINSPRYQQMEYPKQHNDHLNPKVQAVHELLYRYQERAMAETLRKYPQIVGQIKQAKAEAHKARNPLAALQQ